MAAPTSSQASSRAAARTRAHRSRRLPVQAAADEGASLPFTGADLGVLAVAGGLLLGLGLGLRRLTHRPTA